MTNEQTKTHIDDQFMTVSGDENVLLLRWKNDTANLSDDIFKKKASQFANLIKKAEVKNIIIDMRDFKYTLNPELIVWRNQNVIATYNEIGVQKFAFVTEKPTVQQDDTKNTFITQYFKTEADAYKWINS